MRHPASSLLTCPQGAALPFTFSHTPHTPQVRRRPSPSLTPHTPRRPETVSALRGGSPRLITLLHDLGYLWEAPFVA